MLVPFGLCRHRQGTMASEIPDGESSELRAVSPSHGLRDGHGEDTGRHHNIFESSDFNPVEYLNRKFPDERSLETLDEHIEWIRSQISSVDDEVLTAVKEQSESGDQARKDLFDATKSIHALNSKVAEIRHKAEQSEAMVQELCRDIKSLDFAKRHLTTTITALKRLHMLVSAVDQLQSMSNAGQYAEAAKLLEAVNQLLLYFEDYQDIPRIGELNKTVHSIRQDLQQQVFDQFKSLDLDEDFVPRTLADSCQVVDALGEDVRAKLIEWFCNLKIRSYENMFRGTATDASGLEITERRYSWLRKQLKQFEEHFAAVFPRHWNVNVKLCDRFCVSTRQSLEAILRHPDTKKTMDVKLLINVLRTTIEFEKELNSKFALSTIALDDPHGMGGMDSSRDARKERRESIREKYNIKKPGAASGASSPRDGAASPVSEADAAVVDFTGKISKVFESAMHIYVDHEDAQMSETVERILREESWEATDGENANLLSSSTDLFLYIKKCMDRVSALALDKTMLELHRVFNDRLKQYGEGLQHRLPKAIAVKDKDRMQSMNRTEPHEEVKLIDSDVDVICTIINTAEYCCKTVDDLVDNVGKYVSEKYIDEVDYSGARDVFSDTITAAVRLLVVGLCTKIDVGLVALPKQPWETWSEVGDQSEFVSIILKTAEKSMPRIASRISSTYYRFFIDKFVASLIPRILYALYRCKTITHMGAQQLLMDTQIVKNLLLKLPSHLPGKAGSNQVLLNSFSKLVKREFSRTENFLKCVLAPRETVVETYLELFASDGTPADFRKILALQGVIKKEEEAIMEKFFEKAPHLQPESKRRFFNLGGRS